MAQQLDALLYFSLYGSRSFLSLEFKFLPTGQYNCKKVLNSQKNHEALDIIEGGGALHLTPSPLPPSPEVNCLNKFTLGREGSSSTNEEPAVPLP